METPRKFIIANRNFIIIYTWCFHKVKQVYYIHHANVQGTYVLHTSTQTRF